MKANNFDGIAFIYDRLAKLIFGKSIIKSQRHFLTKIPDKATILILGGGTGWILQEITKIKPNVEIIFIDASARMIEVAQLKSTGKNIRFIQGTENHIPDQQFDVVITNFYLDLFREESLSGVIFKVKSSLAPRAIWIATDFVNQRPWHKTTLKLMYLFFLITCNIEAKQLPDWNKALNHIGGKKIESKFFYRNFIEATVFQF